jgi:nucleoside-diphosphate-sugar epimerase
MLHLSTDYVFDGQGTEPWEPDCRDYAPLSVYGRSKLDAELAVSRIMDKYFIVRIAWVFGVNGKNFIKTMLNVGKKYFINVGSVGQPRDGDPRACYAIFDATARTVRFRRIPYDVARAQARDRAAGLPERCAMRLEVGN